MASSSDISRGTTRTSEGVSASTMRPQRRSRAKDPADRKRAVYVEEACIFCKGRKIRCDGKLPCGPCQRRSFDCRYTKPLHGDGHLGSNAPASVSGSPSSRNSDSVGLSELTDIVARLQKKIAILERGNATSSSRDEVSEEHGIGSISSHALPNDVVETQQQCMQDSTAPGSSPVFAGPTSAEFSFGVANIILEQENGASPGQSNQNPELAAALSSHESEDQNVPTSQGPISPDQAALPLHGLQLHDTLRLIQLYHETLGILHPIVEIDALIRTANSVFSVPNSISDSFNQPTTLHLAQLKMVLAIALLGEGGGSCPLAKILHEDLKPVISSQTMARTFTLEGQALLLLTAYFHVNQDDSRLASRYVVIASRIMIEAGLHLKHIRRRLFPHAAEHSRLLVVLTTCMYLDRQLNFNAGLPLTMKEADVDIPEGETMPAYLAAMSSYMRMGPRAWASVTDDRGRLKYRINSEDFEFIDFQVRRWQANLPEDLRMDSSLDNHESETEMAFNNKTLDKGTQNLRFILYLRANQFKIVIMRPLLFSSQTLQANLEHVHKIVHLATDNISTIVTMNERHGLYEKQQPLLNLFLSSALSTLFLIYVHLISNPPQQQQTNNDPPQPQQRPEFIKDVQQGINKGLELLRIYSYCRSSQRLSNKFATLLHRLGFSKSTQQQQQLQSHSGGVENNTQQLSQPHVNPSHSPADGMTKDMVMVGAADSSSNSGSLSSGTASFEFSSWNWSNFLPMGSSPGGVSNPPGFQFQPTNNHHDFASFSYPELNPIPVVPPNGTGQFNDDMLLTFINDFS
ncbi:hypothetical protein H2204_002937 [Knufia peltigerae]|uniref:Zn(2)-C6 fungal-type domain-containing protein n=1 Tax=Knufia peltigerae TaxID=1002370 RepID=A0AA38YBS9_9EURO|nr:hypothetical protein H2204_002937 [Knufia peltigerae]